MNVVNGATDVTTYVVVRDSTNHAPATGFTVTGFDLYYAEQGAAISAKADVTALDAADSAHADNKAYEIGLGLYRIDWPDAAFDGGVGKRVILVVDPGAGYDDIFIEVELSPPVNVTSVGGTAQTAGDLATMIAAVDDYVDTEVGSLATELAKVPKSDSNVSWNATALAAIEAECDDALTANALIGLIIGWLKGKMPVTDNEDGTHTVAVRNALDNADILSWIVNDATGARAANTV